MCRYMNFMECIVPSEATFKGCKSDHKTEVCFLMIMLPLDILLYLYLNRKCIDMIFKSKHYKRKL